MGKEYVVYLGYSEENYIYIGITKDPSTRWRAHLYNSSNKELRELISHGVHFDFEVLEDSLSLQEAQDLEIALIQSYRSTYGSKVLNKSLHTTTIVSDLINKEKHLKTLLTFSQVNAIRKAWNASRGTLKQTDLAIKYKVSLPTIHNIIHNKRWQDSEYVPYKPNKIGGGKLDSSMVPYIRENYQQLATPRPSYREYAEDYGITGVAMGLILRGKSYKSLPGPLLGKDY